LLCTSVDLAVNQSHVRFVRFEFLRGAALQREMDGRGGARGAKQ
jgi:hypothetical protein